MNRRHFAAAAAFAVFATTALVGAAGCSSPSEDDIANGEQAATPANPVGQFGLAETCSRMFKRHESVHDLDIEKGTIRWGCGDVPGVTDGDLGQEYCEYKAVQAGKSITKGSDIVANAPVSCVFTSVFRDVSASLPPQLLAELGKPENLGTAPTDVTTVKMKGPFNTRGAATQLLADCSRPIAATELTKRSRISACFLAYAKGGPNAARLKTLCSGNVLDAAVWTEAESLGAKLAAAGDEAYMAQQDIESCMQVQSAGVAWRNSDPMICSRTFRSASECSCKFNAVPAAVNGFPFVGWVDEQIPSGCRLAKVGGEDYPFLVICDVSAQEVSDIPLNANWSRNVGNFCKDRFAKDLVLTLPLRDLQKTGSCAETAGFCDDYMSTPNATTTDTETPPAVPNRTVGAPVINPGASTN